MSLFLSNEELGKKDDDHKPTKIPPLRRRWTTGRFLPHKMLKRLAIVFVAGVFVYLFITNIPNDMPIRDHRRPDYRGGRFDQVPAAPKPMPKLKPLRAPDWSRPSRPDPLPESGYDGPVVFRQLRASLEAIANTGGSYSPNKNVLFAASSLQSAALLLPLACQMGAELRSYVHFALMSRSEISVDEPRAVNGIDDSCQVIFHGMRLTPSILAVLLG